MKKIITTLSLITVSVFVFGQASMRVLDMTDVNISNGVFNETLPPNTNITTELLATNTDVVSHTYKCKRTVWLMDSDDSTQYCWGGLCYNWGSSVSSVALTIAAGDTVDFAAFGFHAIFRSKMSTMTRYIHYTFYDTTTTSPAIFYDSTGVTIKYNSTTGVGEIVKIGGSLSNAFPNPANEMVSMKYDINEFSQNGTIIFHDMLGKTVKEIVLSDKKGTAKINVDDLNPGVYFYSFIVDGKAISTKKLVISGK